MVLALLASSASGAAGMAKVQQSSSAEPAQQQVSTSDEPLPILEETAQPAIEGEQSSSPAEASVPLAEEAVRLAWDIAPGLPGAAEAATDTSAVACDAVTQTLPPNGTAPLSETAPLTETAALTETAVLSEVSAVGMKVRIRHPKGGGAEYSGAPPYSLSGAPFEITAEGIADGQAVTRFSAPITITVQYTDSQVLGDESMLTLFYYDEAMQTWRPLTSQVDTEANVLTAWSDHLSFYDSMAQNWEAARLPSLAGFQVAPFTGAATIYDTHHQSQTFASYFTPIHHQHQCLLTQALQ